MASAATVPAAIAAIFPVLLFFRSGVLTSAEVSSGSDGSSSVELAKLSSGFTVTSTVSGLDDAYSDL